MGRKRETEGGGGGGWRRGVGDEDAGGSPDRSIMKLVITNRPKEEML